MFFLRTLLYALVEGAFAYLPVSGSALYVLFTSFVHAESANVLTDLSLHLAAAVGIFVLFGKDYQKLLFCFGSAIAAALRQTASFFSSMVHPSAAPESMRRRHLTRGQKNAAMLVAAMAFAALCGLLFRQIGLRAYTSLLINGLGFLISAMFLLLAHLLEDTLSSLSRKHWLVALILGFLAASSIIPGVSYFALVSSAMLLLGYGKRQSFRLACLMYAPLATLYFLYELLHAVGEQSIGGGFFAALICAVCLGIACLFLLSIRKQRAKTQNLSFFAVLNLILGIVCLVIGVNGGVS